MRAALASRLLFAAAVISASGFPQIAQFPPQVNKPPFHAAIADMDGDGFSDVILSGVASGEIDIVKGSGDGRFGIQSRIAATTDGIGVSGSDVNQDGKIDVVYMTPTALLVFLNDGKGALSPLKPIPAYGGVFRAFTVADIDGDGFPDIAVATVASFVVYFGRGDGTFRNATAFPAAGLQLNSIVVADLNGDGHLDIAGADAGASNIAILLGKGDGTFTNASTSALSAVPLAYDSPSQVGVGDFNQDGYPDLVVSGQEIGLSICYGNGDGTFGNRIQYSTSRASFAIGDLNGDGLPDLAVTYINESGAITSQAQLLGIGNATFQPGSPLPYSVLSPFLLTDVNHDGLADLVGISSSANVFSALTLPRLVRSLSVVSVANFSGPLTPNSIAAAFGKGLASNTMVSPDSLHLSPALLGTLVTVTDSLGAERQAGLFLVSPGQVTFQVPPATALGTATIAVTSGSAQFTANVQIQAVAPAIFTNSKSGIAASYILRVTANSQSIEQGPVDLSKEGDVYLIMYGTGFDTPGTTSCSLAGKVVNVSYAGPQGSTPGLDQVNILLPKSLTGAGLVNVDLYLGATTNSALVTIQ